MHFWILIFVLDFWSGFLNFCVGLGGLCILNFLVILIVDRKGRMR